MFGCHSSHTDNFDNHLVVVVDLGALTWLGFVAQMG